MNMQKKLKLSLVGADGNAFALMGLFSKTARREGWSSTEIDSVMKECQSGDYDHLLRTLIQHTVSDEDGYVDEFGE